MEELGNFLGDMFKNFPIFTIIFVLVVVYTFWYATGGVERGQARREAGEAGLFVKVKGVPQTNEANEMFGSFPYGSSTAP